jgi:hypothetical protein
MPRTPHPYGSPALGPFAPPPPPPPPTRRSRPWVLPIAIGCGGSGGLVLLAVVFLVIAGVIAKLPNISTTGATGSCRVSSVCATVDGVSLVLSGVDRNYQLPVQTPMAVPLPSGLPKGTPTLPPIPQFTVAPRPGFHIVRVELVFEVVDNREHEILPGGVFLTDALGQFQGSNELLDEATCSTSLGGAYGTGAKVGPTPLCFEAAGPVNGVLTLNWSGAEVQLP